MDDAAALTDLIHRARAGDEAALRLVFDKTYEELHRLAQARLGRGARHTLLDTTSLVHESYLRFASAGELQIEDRTHFMRYAGHVMRSVIVDFVRRRNAERRGGDLQRVTLSTHVADDVAEGEDEILRVHEALETLQKIDPRLVEVVEMRYYGGMTEPEIAQALERSERTVRRDWEKARLLLAEVLE